MFKSFSHWLPPSGSPKPQTCWLILRSGSQAAGIAHRTALRRLGLAGRCSSASDRDLLEANPETRPRTLFGGRVSWHVAARPRLAVKMLPQMPDTERDGLATAIKLDIAWDDMSPGYGICRASAEHPGQCGPKFAVRSKNGGWSPQGDGPAGRKRTAARTSTPSNYQIRPSKRKCSSPLTGPGSSAYSQKGSPDGASPGCNACSTSPACLRSPRCSH